MAKGPDSGGPRGPDRIRPATPSPHGRDAEPVAGAELAGRETGRIGWPRASVRASPMKGQAPWFAGSSCTHRSSA